ncbi:MAG TPA: adenosylcobalamin-dependent ribonucleoside-diphosphate reductase, partial [Blastocatellia bacterium]|nr:adenosylcobalamin-dependent ribonucleoside-diphosphate reductase [Blastocatellia bacterium]
MSTRSVGDIQKSNGQTPVDDSISPIVPHADVRKSGAVAESNQLTELGQKIFLDRYALKDMSKRTLSAGDMVIVCTDAKTGQREIGVVTAMDETAAAGSQRVTVELRDGTQFDCLTEHVAKPIETDPEQMMERVARGIAAVEGERADEWYQNFRWLLNGWKFVPAGRILTAAGTDQQLTFYNCYVVPSPKDSRRGIVDTLSQMMEIMSRGGGVGINVSSLRPRHSYVKGVNGRSSGSVSWGALYSFVTGLIEQGGSRRGALMLILNCWHPDVIEFITSKREMGKITNANISVGISDKFMDAVHANADWDLVFPDNSDPDYAQTWDGNLDKWMAAGKRVIVHKTVKARAIWDSIIESAWASAEPGVFFIERANKMSNSWYYDAGYLGCTNPCGEQPLPGFGVCNLGAINLSKFVSDGDVAWDDLGKAVRYSVRFLDNVIDATPYFFDENYAQQKAERRVGLNTMGLAEMLIRLGIRYGSEESVQFIDRLYRFIAGEAYHASADNASEKGPFPMFEADKFLQSGYMKKMPEDVRQEVREKGVRNVTLLTQAPNGTIGTMVGTSTGIEPFYFWNYFRKSRLGKHEERVKVLEEWQQAHPGEPLPGYFVTAMDLAPEEHVKVQAAIQTWVDSSISKTCNLPASYTPEQTREIYELLYRSGCKGGTIYRDGSRDVQVLNLKEEDKKTSEPATVVAAKTAIAAAANEQRAQENSAITVVEKESAPSSSELVQSDGGWQPKVRPRPYKRRGYTVSKATPSGTAHITMNEDEDGHPFEVFLEIGKAGSDIKAMAEAMGRLMSLILRMASPVSPLERVREIVKQISGIGGARSYGFGKRRVLSLPDAVGQALAENYLNISQGTEADGQGAEMGVEPIEAAAASHKSSPAAVGSVDLCPSC